MITILSSDDHHIVIWWSSYCQMMMIILSHYDHHIVKWWSPYCQIIIFEHLPNMRRPEVSRSNRWIVRKFFKPCSWQWKFKCTFKWKWKFKGKWKLKWKFKGKWRIFKQSLSMTSTMLQLIPKLSLSSALLSSSSPLLSSGWHTFAKMKTTVLWR